MLRAAFDVLIDFTFLLSYWCFIFDLGLCCTVADLTLVSLRRVGCKERPARNIALVVAIAAIPLFLTLFGSVVGSSSSAIGILLFGYWPSAVVIAIKHSILFTIAAIRLVTHALTAVTTTLNTSLAHPLITYQPDACVCLFALK